MPFYYVELGKEWAPAIADSFTEHDNIGRVGLLLDNPLAFWIGGSTNQRQFDSINYSDYIPDDYGN